MKRFKNLLKLFSVHAMIFSLVQTSIAFSSAQAQVTGQDIQNVANIALSTYGSFLGQKQQMIQQQIMAQKNSALMQKLSPSCKNADGTYCYQSAGKFFPECPLPATMATMPQNVCSETLPDQAQSAAQISSMITYEAVAKSWVNYYDQMSNEATNVAFPAGLKCLTDKTKKLDSEIIEMINNLTRLQDQLNRDKEIFKANNKKLLEELSQTNDELMGISKKNLALKTTPFAKYFSTSCQSIIGEGNIATGADKGLLAIQQIIAPNNKRAADYNQNRTAIEAQIRNDVTKMQASIASGGLDDYFAGKHADNTKLGSVKFALEKQAVEFKIAKERIANELLKIGYQIPAMDNNFSVDFNEFLKGSSSFFKKSYINDCVTGADKSGMAISTDQILNNLQQKSTNSGGTARDKYRVALRNILESDSFIDDKLAQIKSLESTYKDISITYQSNNGQRVTETPYDLYIKTLAKCEQRFAQDDTFSASGSNGVSQKKKVDRGQALLRELKSLHDNFSSNLSAKVLDQALSCNGEAKKSGGSCGAEDSFNHEKPSFCMSHANLCANEVNACYAEATNLVETKKAKMNALAKTFNANAEAMVIRSNQLYNLQKANVMEMVKLIQGRFPGTNFTIPENMFISMPELKKDTYGIDLASDGNMAFMDELPKKIDSLKKIFKDQQAKVAAEIGDYIDKQKNAMSTQRGRWDALANECTGMISNVKRDLAKSNAEGQKNQAEQDQKTGNFCRKYAEMSENPVGACNGADKLAEEADQISARLTNNALSFTGKFRNLCNQYNNEAEDDTPDFCNDDRDKLQASQKSRCKAYDEADRKRLEALNQGSSKSSKRKINFNSLCKSKGVTNNDKDFIAKVIEKLPAADKDLLKDATTFSDIEAKYDQLESFEFFDTMSILRRDDKQPICEQLAPLENVYLSSSATKDEIMKKAEEDTAKVEAKSTTTEVVSSKVDEINKIKEKRDNQIDKLTLNDALASLAGPTVTKEEIKTSEISRLGEQIDGSCDAQASNTNIAKDWGSSLLKSFDSAILGTAK